MKRSLAKLIKDKETIKFLLAMIIASLIIIAVEGIVYFGVLALVVLLFAVVIPYVSKGFDFLYDKYIDVD